jgi:hypothetical protein
MIKDKKIFIILLVFVVFSAFLIWKLQGYFNPSIFTNRTDYRDGEKLKVTIKNTLNENICFSSCYPYYMEKKNDNWESYDYGICDKENINEVCIEPDEVKAFEIDLVLVEKGPHRLALPACLGCNVGDYFREIKRFYSNEFIIEGK